MAERFKPRESERYQERIEQLGGVATAAAISLEMHAPHTLNPGHLTEDDFNTVLRRPDDDDSRTGIITRTYRVVRQYASQQEGGITKELGKLFIARATIQELVDTYCTGDRPDFNRMKRQARGGIGNNMIVELQLLLDLTAPEDA